MSSRFDAIGFDADDTLWHTERLYVEVQTRFKALLAQYHSPDWIEARLYEAEMRNLPHFGYGIKAFALSLIETAVELTEGRVAGRDVQAIVDLAKGMLAAEVELLEHAAATVALLAEHYPLLLITKGDLRDQEQKIARSGLAEHFRQIEIVSDKSAPGYAALLRRHGIAPERFLMVGNSLRSDILPVLALGASAVYVPYALTWLHEAADPPPAGQPGFYELEHLGRLPALLDEIDRPA
ncbi:MAG: HAD family hydrolase [Anaerolineales bacterium]|nr:HAD family hydrolase [Anaerolineales bacterium]